jgi:hypothetical protein
MGTRVQVPAALGRFIWAYRSALEANLNQVRLTPDIASISEDFPLD